MSNRDEVGRRGNGGCQRGSGHRALDINVKKVKKGCGENKVFFVFKIWLDLGVWAK